MTKSRSPRPAALLDAELAARLELALLLGRNAAQHILPFFRTDDLGLEIKEDGSPVTRADREAEALLRKGIEARFSDDGIVGEEFGEIDGRDPHGFRWILDPIDGTESFVRWVPLFGTLIGIEFSGVAVGGVLALPALGEILHAARDQGAWLTRGSQAPIPARVSQTAELSRALVCHTGGSGFHHAGRGDVLARLERSAAQSRGWGDCYGYALVATGRADVMLDPRMHLWDNAPLLPILEEAGGRFTDWDGVPTIYSPNVVASNGRLHSQVLAILSS